MPPKMRQLGFHAPTGLFSYYVNDMLAGSVTDANFGTANGTVGINRDIMQAYNFNDPSIEPVGAAANTEYTALWSNTPSATTATPEPASIALMATGLFGMVGIGYKKRRNS